MVYYKNKFSKKHKIIAIIIMIVIFVVIILIAGLKLNELAKKEPYMFMCEIQSTIEPLATDCEEINNLLLKGEENMFKIYYKKICEDNTTKEWVERSGSSMDAYIFRCLD